MKETVQVLRDRLIFAMLVGIPIMQIVLFNVPFEGDLLTLSAALIVFIIANLAIGFTFSTFAKSQVQAMQMGMFYFMPSMQRSGFLFPFRGMPQWAQAIGRPWISAMRAVSCGKRAMPPAFNFGESFGDD